MRRRFKIVYVVLIMATLLYISYYFYRFYCYNQLPTTHEDPELGTVFVTPVPFPLTSEASTLHWLGVSIVVAWTVVILYGLFKELKEVKT